MTQGLADRFREMMRRTASGVAILTTDGLAGRAGITVSTSCSLSMEPLSVVARAFAGMIPEMRDDRFVSGFWQTLVTGTPVLQGVLAAFDCKTASTFDFGTHRILIGEVVEVVSGDGDPILFADRNFHRLLAA